MKILLLVPALPWPPHTGATQRIAAIAERLAARHEMFLFALEGEAGSVEATIAAPFARVKTIRYPGLPPRTAFGFWSQVLRDPLPKAVRQAVSDDALTHAATFAGECAPDAIVAEPIEMAPYLDACAAAAPGATTMMGWIDVVSKNIARQTSRDTAFSHRVHARAEVRKMARLERAVAHRVDVRTCVSAVDQEILQAMTGEPFVLAPNGVDTERFTPVHGAVNERQVLFVGPLGFAPNRDGVQWFADDVLPSLPGVTLTVAGEPSGFAAPPGVGLAGRVSDTRPMTARAGAVVVPLRSGSGTRLKILEALAMGKAVITTTIGAEGLDVRGDEHLLIADDAAAFAAATRRVLDDADLRERLGRSGRALVERRYQWEPTVRAIEEALRPAGAKAARR